MTACRGLELYATCHQLRMHESNTLDCYVTVGSGPILEDCTNIVFRASRKDDLVYDAKDFNWLRNGIPSPNFCVVEEILDAKETKYQNTTGPCKADLADETRTENGGSEEAALKGSVSTNAVQSDDDDDEL